MNNLNTTPQTFILNGVEYSAYKRKSFCFNQKLLDHYKKNNTSGFLIYIEPSPGKLSVKGYYIFSPEDIEKYLMPKTLLRNWENKKEWAQSNPPNDFQKFFTKI